MLGADLRVNDNQRLPACKTYQRGMVKIQGKAFKEEHQAQHYRVSAQTQFKKIGDAAGICDWLGQPLKLLVSDLHGHVRVSNDIPKPIGGRPPGRSHVKSPIHLFVLEGRHPRQSGLSPGSRQQQYKLGRAFASAKYLFGKLPVCAFHPAPSERSRFVDHMLRVYQVRLPCIVRKITGS